MTSQLPSYTKAQFFKCALQVNPYGYIQYRGQGIQLTEEEYNRQLLINALEAGIQVVGLADHGSVAGIDSIRELFQQNGIVVFPGFEIASSEKIHFVCLFDEGKTAQELERILGSLQLLDPQNGVSPSSLSGTQLIEEVNNQGGFIYAAHSTNDSGILKLRMNHVWKHEKLLAAQIPGSLADLQGVESDFYRKAFLNRDSGYLRDRPMAAINAADVAKPEDLLESRSSCLIKMTKPCFTSFKQAFLDAGSRVRLNSDSIENYSSALESLKFTGGYLDGVEVEFSKHLNAVIGGRGTGKSTLLECIRFVLEIEPKTTEAKKQHHAIIDNNLGKEGGMVELSLRSATMQGRRFKISRKYGSSATVTDASGKISPYQPADLLPNIELYGQNEIYELTRDSVSRNKLIQRFLEGEHQGYEAAIEKLCRALKENRDNILQVLDKKNELESELERLPILQEQAKQYQDLGIDEKLKIIPLLEKEKQLSTRVHEDLERVKNALEVLRDSLPDTVFLSDASLVELPNADLFQQNKKLLDELKEQGQTAATVLEEAVQRCTEKLMPLQQELNTKHLQEEETVEQAFKKIPTSQGKTGREIGADYQRLLQQIERIKPFQQQLKTHTELVKELFLNRKKYLLELETQLAEHSSHLHQAVKRLNRKLQDKVRLNLKTEGNRQPLYEYLLNSGLEGIGAKRLLWVLEQSFSPIRLAEIVREQNSESLMEIFNISSVVANALLKLSEAQLLEIEELLLLDSMDIELNVRHAEQEAVFRPLEQLSTGQQCTAILHLLLLENSDPLILDQPEDNLDNAFIAERIVAELRRAKLIRQFLFATHNANIPVFGDAEWIGVLTVEESKGRILPEQQGAIDVPEVQRLAADILEGGKAAFNQRREKYNF